jgi:hypothetical protein
MRNTVLKARLILAGAVLLAAGLCAGLLVAVLAEDVPAEGVGYVLADGNVTALDPNQSKRYIRDLERFGGKAAVLFDEINRWFAALWRGKTLGLTIAGISAIVSLGIFLFAGWLPPDRE